MKVQTEESIINALATQVARLESVLAEAKLILRGKATVAAADVSKTSPIIYRRVRLLLDDGTPDNLNCLTFAFRIVYNANVLQVGWSLASNENVDLDRGRALAAERLHVDPLEADYYAAYSLVDNVYLHFYGEPLKPVPNTIFENRLFAALKRKLRSMQSQKAADVGSAFEDAVEASAKLL